MIKTVGRYQILERIGQGGMGTVYKGFDPLLQRTVAVKVIAAQLEASPELRERFFREARAAGQLSHKNIVVIHDLGEEDGHPFLAMEYLQGQNLDARIRSVGRMRLDRTLDVVSEICEGLEYAHSRGVVHRDIKPANIFLTDSGSVRILDFGLARLVASELTRSHTVMGTANYMAPEQIRGEPIDHRADIFSVGVVLYELLTGRKAFEGDSVATTIFKILQETPEPPQKFDASLPLQVVAVVDRALAKPRDERYQSIGQMLRDLMLCRELGRPGEPAFGAGDPLAARQVLPSSAGGMGPQAAARASSASGPSPGSSPSPSGPPAAAEAGARRAGAPARWLLSGALLVALVAGSLWLWRSATAPPPEVSPRPAGGSEATPGVDTGTRESAAVDRPAPEPGGEPASPADPPPAPPPARRTAPTEPSPEPAAAPPDPARREEPAARPAPATPAPTTPAPSAPEPTPNPEQQSADRALTAMTRAKAAAEAADADSLASGSYDAALETEREGRNRYDAGRFADAVPLLYEAAGLFRSAAVEARTARARPDPSPQTPGSADAERAAPAPAPEPAPPASPPGPTVAATPPEVLIQEVLTRYVSALESRDLEALKRSWPSMSSEQEQAIRREFAQARSIRAELLNPRIEATSETAQATVRRRYEIVTTDGITLQTETLTTVALRKTAGGWVIEDIRHQASP